MAIARQDVNISSPEATTSDAQSTANPTVLVFDSGVGGLSIYREIREKLPEIDAALNEASKGWKTSQKDHRAFSLW